jgi:DNA mismatch repair ATPase MutS
MEDIFNSFKEQFQDEELSIDDKINLIKQNEMEIEFLIEDTLDISNLFNNDSVTFNDSLCQDIELFTDHLNNKDEGLFTKLDNTITFFGKKFLENKLKTPTYNLEMLNIQKNNITKFLPHINKYVEKLEIIQNTEKDIMWFWKEIDEHLESVYDMIYFNNKYLKFFNYNEILLLVMNFYKMFISPIMTCISPISSVIFLFIMYKYYKINIPFSEIIKLCKQMFMNQFSSSSKIKMFFSLSIWIFFYIQSVYQSISISRQINKISNIFHEKINIIYKLVNTSLELLDLQQEHFLELKFSDIKNSLDRFIPSLNKKLYQSEPSVFTNKGNIFSTYYTLLDIKDELKPILLFISEIDYYISICLLYNKFSDKNNKFSLPTYTDKDKLNIELDNCWHPYLENKPVLNNIKLNKNIIITGPNAAGKSTFIKTILINVLLAQTISLSSSSNMDFTIFKNINSYLHIPDTKGKESLFEAEMNRSLNYIKYLRTHKQDKSLIIMDELFSSTNNKEGIEAAKIVCKEMIKFKNNLTLLTTHYSELSILEKDTKKIKNYKFLIKRDINNNIIFTYKLKKGFSKDYIALELFSKKMEN